MQESQTKEIQFLKEKIRARGPDSVNITNKLTNDVREIASLISQNKRN